MNNSGQPAAKLPAGLRNVACGFNGFFTVDIHGAMGAVIINPRATPAQRLAWAMGQLQLLATSADVIEPEVGEAAAALADVVQQLLEQSMAVLEAVLKEMEGGVQRMEAEPLALGQLQAIQAAANQIGSEIPERVRLALASVHVEAYGASALQAATGAIGAIINPQATLAQRLAWAMGQLRLITRAAEIVPADDGEPAASLASVVLQLVEQSMSVLQDVLNQIGSEPKGEERPLQLI